MTNLWLISFGDLPCIEINVIQIIQRNTRELIFAGGRAAFGGQSRGQRRHSAKHRLLQGQH